MEELSPKQWIIAIILVGLIAFGAGNITGVKVGKTKNPSANKDTLKIQTPKQSDVVKPELKDITIYVTGEVNNPDVYKLPEGSIVKDAILKAGGTKKEADLIAINLARKLTDGEEIIVPKRGAENADTSSSGGKTSGNGKININTANVSALEQLPGIGEVKANAIIQYRKEHNGFKTINEITRVNGIGEKTFEKIKNLITVG